MKATTEQRIEEQLKDRRAYRATLIQKQEETEAKIENVEAQIKSLQESRKAA